MAGLLDIVSRLCGKQHKKTRRKESKCSLLVGSSNKQVETSKTSADQSRDLRHRSLISVVCQENAGGRTSRHLKQAGGWSVYHT